VRKWLRGDRWSGRWGWDMLETALLTLQLTGALHGLIVEERKPWSGPSEMQFSRVSQVKRWAIDFTSQI
jgi:hypothetical protein